LRQLILGLYQQIYALVEVIASPGTKSILLFLIPTLTAQQFFDMIAQAAGRPVPVHASVASPALLAAAGTFSPLLREMREMACQFRAPLVIDSSRFDAAFGRLEPTPHSDAVAQTVAWYRSADPAPAAAHGRLTDSAPHPAGGAMWRNGRRVGSMYRPRRDAPTRSSGMNEPQINVDHFYHRPVYHVVGLLTENSEVPAISKDLASAGVDVTAVEILCGEQGARILDEHGRYHGLRGRIVRAFQRLGYDETTLAIYDEALRKGDLLLQVPAPPAQRRRVVELLQHHHVHDVGYFAPGTFEQFPILDAD
jgi:hypothetical protein